MRDLDVRRHQARGRKESTHVAVDVRRMDSHRCGTIDLGTELPLDFDETGFVGDDGVFVGEGARGIEQGRNLVSRFNAPPAIGLPLAGDGEMQTEVGVRMRAGVGRDLRNPWRRHHYARRRDHALVERVEARRIHRMRGAEIVGVQNQELRVARITKPLSNPATRRIRSLRGAA